MNSFISFIEKEPWCDDVTHTHNLQTSHKNGTKRIHCTIFNSLFIFSSIFCRCRCHVCRIIFLRNTRGHGFNSWSSVAWLSSWRILGNPTCIFLACDVFVTRKRISASLLPPSVSGGNSSTSGSHPLYSPCAAVPLPVYWTDTCRCAHIVKQPWGKSYPCANPHVVLQIVPTFIARVCKIFQKCQYWDVNLP